MENWILHILKLIVFITPTYIANTAPVFAAKANFMNFLNKPIDFNIKFKEKPLFGNHKTIRGYVVGIPLGILTALILNLIFNFWTIEQSLLYGFLLSLGALLGDTIKSFFKRRINISPGKDWIPFDQLDYSIGALLLSGIVIIWSWYDYIFLITLSLILHIVANKIKIKIWKK